MNPIKRHFSPSYYIKTLFQTDNKKYLPENTNKHCHSQLALIPANQPNKRGA